MLYDFKTPREYDDFVSQYVRGAFSTYDMEVFIPEVKKLKPGQTYLEIGVDQGKSLLTATFAARSGVNVVGLDILDTPERIEAFRLLGLERTAVFVHADSETVSRVWRDPIGVLFIDGDHSYSGVMRDIKCWVRFVSKNRVVLFHDCDESSPGVVQAVTETFGDKVQLFKTPNKNTSMALVRI